MERLIVISLFESYFGDSSLCLFTSVVVDVDVDVDVNVVFRT